MEFLLFIGSIFPKRAGANTTTFFPGSISICGDLSRGKPLGHEVGISLRPITLLPDEKEPGQKQRPVSGSPGAGRRREVATSWTGIRPAAVHGGGSDGPYPRRSSAR